MFFVLLLSNASDFGPAFMVQTGVREHLEAPDNLGQSQPSYQDQLQVELKAMDEQG